ncbi:Eukaryotic translation initiation factor 3 subunit H [Aphelenchoides besseyi]|nr:Eukaryotic translation initiation factor 3 subunit H [Aphelenchoides besseyi]KAI6202463.1 Eukaryotic translation initiation factor 3 subunit H [Aphelenchoides besseyi]
MSFDSFSGPSAKVDNVQIDSLVIMKLVKHVDSEFYSGMSDVAGEACQGILTGLISPAEKRLEITNCFPTPRSELGVDGDDAAQSQQSYEEKQYETMEMLRRFRQMNIDYEVVGFYQAHLFGACYTEDMIISLAEYQANLTESVVLVYDPVSTRQGRLSIRALRLSPKAFDLCQNTDWSPEIVKNSGVTFTNMLQELPVTIKNSRLMNVMLAELKLLHPQRNEAHLELGTRNGLEKSLRSSISVVEELNKTIGSYNKYTLEKQRYDAMLNTLIQKRQIENEARQVRGEPKLSIDELKRQHKQPQLQTKSGMLELFLNCGDTEKYADYAAHMTAENISKLFISEAAGQSGNVQVERETPL